MLIGTVLGFSAILLPQLAEEGHILKNSDEASWVASLSNIGQCKHSITNHNSQALILQGVQRLILILESALMDRNIQVEFDLKVFLKS